VNWCIQFLHSLIDYLQAVLDLKVIYLANRMTNMFLQTRHGKLIL